jgi:predicted acyltransferase (DUF342 family)
MAEKGENYAILIGNASQNTCSLDSENIIVKENIMLTGGVLY